LLHDGALLLHTGIFYHPSDKEPELSVLQKSRLWIETEWIAPFGERVNPITGRSFWEEVDTPVPFSFYLTEALSDSIGVILDSLVVIIICVISEILFHCKIVDDTATRRHCSRELRIERSKHNGRGRFHLSSLCVTDREFLTNPSRINAEINSKSGNTSSHVIVNRYFQAATSW